MLTESEIENFYESRGIGIRPAGCNDVFVYFDSGEFSEVYEAVWQISIVPGVLKVLGNAFREQDEEPLTPSEFEDAEDHAGLYEYLLDRDPGVFRYGISRVATASDLFLLTEASIDDLRWTFLPRDGQAPTPRALSFMRWLSTEMENNPLVHDEFVSRRWLPINGIVEEKASTAQIRAASDRMHARFKQELETRSRA